MATPEETDLDKLHRSLKQLNTGLENLNSAYPETKRFLEARGLTNVRQLDKQGLDELKAHLTEELKAHLTSVLSKFSK